MVWKTFVNRFAITSRGRGLATAVVYGLSRFTSATGEEVEIPAESMQRTSSLISIMKRNGVQLPYQDWSPNSAQPIVFRRSWLPSSGGCRAACESPMPMSLMAGCRAP